MKRIYFFLFIILIGFFLFSSVVYCEFLYDEESKLISDVDDCENDCPHWLTNLATMI